MPCEVYSDLGEDEMTCIVREVNSDFGEDEMRCHVRCTAT